MRDLGKSSLNTQGNDIGIIESLQSDSIPPKKSIQTENRPSSVPGHIEKGLRETCFGANTETTDAHKFRSSCHELHAHSSRSERGGHLLVSKSTHVNTPLAEATTT